MTPDGRAALRVAIPATPPHDDLVISWRRKISDHAMTSNVPVEQAIDLVAAAFWRAALGRFVVLDGDVCAAWLGMLDELVRAGYPGVVDLRRCR